jgi:hypothetical protein
MHIKWDENTPVEETTWEFLMNILDKIESMGYSINIKSDLFATGFKYSVEIYSLNDDDIFLETNQHDSRMEAIRTAVIKFISEITGTPIQDDQVPKNHLENKIMEECINFNKWIYENEFVKKKYTQPSKIGKWFSSIREEGYLTDNQLYNLYIQECHIKNNVETLS